MTYTFPPSLHPLRDYLKGQGADTRAFASARQAAFMAQQLLGTRVKFPDKGADMTSTLFMIQKAVTEKDILVRNIPAAIDGKAKKMKSASGLSKREVRHLSKEDWNKRNRKERIKERFPAEKFSEGLHIFCDGASVPNPGVGGWGVVVYEDGAEIASAFGGDPDTTNNQMELTGLLNALEQAWKHITEWPEVTIWCDSQYCVKGVNEWMPGWKAKGWQRGGANAEPQNRVVMNVDLWKAIDEKMQEFPKFGKIHVRWVKGHHGVAGNERADQLAEQGRLEAEERGRSEDELSLLDQVNDLDARFKQIMGAV
ncbi:ribonuclease HI [Rhizobium oryzihabitans]|uniref:ribonuclease H n=1 Tax=Rhizobium oryzihabitans TaxID=2267833 RepID=A0A7L5BH43_9HYPH|nr:ribonuclease H [Rhizobium oryzihabitans]QIB38142.1 ribonuclease HI [Rhizobium oryzihabitans]